MPAERRFVGRGLDATKDQMVAIIRGHPKHLIPRPFNPSKMKRENLKSLLLDPDSPFRTTSVLKNQELQSISPKSPRAIDPPAQIATPQSPTQSDHSVSESHATDLDESDLDEVSGQLNLRVYIEDHRFNDESIQSKTVAHMLLPGVMRNNCVYITAQHFLEQLQSGHAAIRGSGAVKVGFRDTEKPDFIEFFAESEPSKLHVADTDPSEFCVSANQDANVTAYIDFVDRQPAIEHSVAEMPGFSQNEDRTQADPITQQDPGSRLDLANWLRVKAAAQPEYKLFSSSRHRPLQNHEAVRVWSFISLFTEQFFKKSHQFPYKNKKIKKSDIYTALGIKETSLGDAEEATRILRIFGEGGTHPADEVVSRVALTTDPPHGSVRLLKFLKAYDRAHSGDIISM